jgi:hypothetical protein
MGRVMVSNHRTRGLSAESHWLEYFMRLPGRARRYRRDRVARRASRLLNKRERRILTEPTPVKAGARGTLDRRSARIGPP